MLLRYRMNRLIRLLKTNQENEVLDLIASDKYRDALLTLETIGCVKLAKAWGGKITYVSLLDSRVGYQLSRHEVWENRFIGFLAGAATSVVAHYVIALIDLWLSSR